MSKCPLSSQKKGVAAVVSLNSEAYADYAVTEESLRDYLAANCSLWAYIKHDLDSLPDGKMKTPHVHIVANGMHRKRLSTWISDIAKAMSVDVFAVNIEPLSSFEAAFQYLIHKNNPEKYQYGIEEVRTNIPEDQYDLYLDASRSPLDFDEIVRLCETCDSLIDIIEYIGVSSWLTYHRVVKDIWLWVKGKEVR